MPLDLSIMPELYQERIFALARAEGLLPDDRLWEAFGIENPGWIVALPVVSWDTPPCTVSEW